MHYIIEPWTRLPVQTLIRLNQQFYQTFAEQFSATRQQIQPGVRNVIRQMPPECRILDLGCGNGKLWQRLVEQGFQGQYVGLDFSSELLEVAAQQASQTIARQPAISPPLFIQADLTENGWENGVPQPAYDFVLAFAVLHHLPGESTVIQVLQKIQRFLAPGGKFIFSVWQFLNSPRLRERIQDWSEIGLSDQPGRARAIICWTGGREVTDCATCITSRFRRAGEPGEPLRFYLHAGLTFQMGKVAILACTRPGNWKM